MRICSVEGCREKHSAKGFCSKHYHADYRKRTRAYLKKYKLNKSIDQKTGELERRAETRKGYRIAVIHHYSNGLNKCACCGEVEFKFLTLDHINGGGGKHRKEVGAGTTMLRWLMLHDFPEGFQVLCYNCNIGRERNVNRVCPHKEVQNANL